MAGGDMPKTSVQSKTTSYKILSPVKIQRKFQSRRKFARGRESISRHGLDQSTLTQFDFSSTPNNGIGRQLAQSDDDSEFEEPRPKKKRRTDPHSHRKDIDQTTLTQIVPSILDSVQKECRNRPTISRKWEVNQGVTPAATSRVGRIRTLQLLGSDENEDAVMNRHQEHADIFRHQIDLNHTKGRHAAREQRTENTFTPPQKQQCTEVPSSQTPQSMLLRSQRKACERDLQRSPLAERSSNILEAKIVGIPPLLTNQKGICQNEEILKQGNHLSKDNRRQGFEDAVGRKSESQSPISGSPPHSSLPSSHTISAAVSGECIVDGGRGHLSNESTGDMDVPTSYFPETYDPAYEALSRDAARCKWTQTQQMEDLPENGKDLDNDSDDDDLDRLCGQRSSMPHHTPTWIKGRHLGTSQESLVVPNHFDDNNAEHRPDDDQTSSPSIPKAFSISAAKTNASQQVVTRSQASTCTDTLADVSATSSPQTVISVSAQSETPPFRSNDTTTSSPLRSTDRMLSPSMPLALCTSHSNAELPSRPSNDRHDYGTVTQLDRLMDFSLPPPPHLCQSIRE